MTAPTNERAVHYEVELRQHHDEEWRRYETMPSLDGPRFAAEMYAGRGSQARIRRVVSARTVEVVEIIGVEGGG